MNTAEEKKHTEEFSLNGSELVERIKALIKQGNIRRIVIKNEPGVSLMELPVTVGVVGALLLPTLAAVGAVAALVTKCTIVVEKKAE
jgi:hypothetical protein